MAEKTKASRAEQKVTDAKKKTSASESTSKSKKTTSKSTTGKSSQKANTGSNPIPNHVVTALLSLVLFVLFLVIAINPDGALLKVVQSVVLGLIGQAGFYFAIPALAYLFIINTFLRKSAIRMRSICVVLFVFFCGAIFHLCIKTPLMDQGIGMIPDL